MPRYHGCGVLVCAQTRVYIGKCIQSTYLHVNLYNTQLHTYINICIIYVIYCIRICTQNSSVNVCLV